MANDVTSKTKLVAVNTSIHPTIADRLQRRLDDSMLDKRKVVERGLNLVLDELDAKEQAAKS